LEAIRQPDAHHSEMQQVGVNPHQGGLLATMLRGGGREGGSDLPAQGASRPQASGLVEEAGHLRRHAAIARTSADDDCVVIDEFVDLRDRCLLVELVAGCDGNALGNEFWYPPDVYRSAGCASAFRDRFGHLFDMSV